MQKPRPKALLIRDLMQFGQTPITGKGGWPNRLRAVQLLAIEAALELAKWGRTEHARQQSARDRARRPADLFRPQA